MNAIIKEKKKKSVFLSLVLLIHLLSLYVYMTFLRLVRFIDPETLQH